MTEASDLQNINSSPSNFYNCDLCPQVRLQDYDRVLNSKAQILIIGTFDSPKLAEQIWERLQAILSKTDYKLTLFGQSVLVSISGEDDEQIVKKVIAEYQGDIVIENFGYEEYITVLISAEAPNLQIANEIADRIKLYLQSNGRIRLYLRPPWLDNDISSQQKERENKARYTYVKLKTNSMGYWEMLGYACCQLILGLLLCYHLEIFYKIVARKAEKDNRRQAELILATRDPKIDPETVALFLESAKQENQRGYFSSNYSYRASGATLALGQRLGQMRLENGLPILEDSMLGVNCGMLEQQGTTLNFNEFVFARTHEGILALVLYLRDRGFINVKYKFTYNEY